MSYVLERISDDEPMITDPFYKWLDQFNKRALPKHAIVEYLKYTGFIVGDDELADDDYKFLKFILDHWFDNTPEHNAPCNFDELFIMPGNFYILGKACRYAISPKLREIVNTSGWIYNIDPSTTYFQLIDDRLFAKYQSILGSRFLCRII